MKLLPPIESQDTMFSALSYPLGFFVSPFLLFSNKKDDSFVRFHAIQGLVVNVLVTVIALLCLVFLFLVSKTSPSADTIRDISKYEPNPMNNGYMNNGCVFMVVWGLYFLFVLALFLAEVFCASRVWAGEDLRLPFIGPFIEKKYFADIVAIEQEAERTGGGISTQTNTSSIDNLPTTRHDIPFVKNSTPVADVPKVMPTQQVQVQPKDQQSSIQDALAYAKRQQSLYSQNQTQQTITQSNANYNNPLNQEMTRTSYNEQGSYNNKSVQSPSRNYSDGTSSIDRTRTYSDGTSSSDRTRTYSDGTSSIGRTRTYSDGTSSAGRTRTYADGTSSTSRSNTYADGSAKKIQL